MFQRWAYQPSALRAHCGFSTSTVVHNRQQMGSCPFGGDTSVATTSQSLSGFSSPRYLVLRAGAVSAPNALPEWLCGRVFPACVAHQRHERPSLRVFRSASNWPRRPPLPFAAGHAVRAPASRPQRGFRPIQDFEPFTPCPVIQTTSLSPSCIGIAEIPERALTDAKSRG